MKLTDYIKSNRGNGAALAKSMGIPPAFLSQMAIGYRAVTAERAVRIERATQGQVKRWDLRPDDWHDIWPELVNAPGAPRIQQPAHA